MFCGEQGLVRYWHIGNKRNANAIVARTEEKKNHSNGSKGLTHLNCFLVIFHLLNGAAKGLSISIISTEKGSSLEVNYSTENVTVYFYS